MSKEVSDVLDHYTNKKVILTKNIDQYEFQNQSTKNMAVRPRRKMKTYHKQQWWGSREHDPS